MYSGLLMPGDTCRLGTHVYVLNRGNVATRASMAHSYTQLQFKTSLSGQGRNTRLRSCPGIPTTRTGQALSFMQLQGKTEECVCKLYLCGDARSQRGHLSSWFTVYIFYPSLRLNSVYQRFLPSSGSPWNSNVQPSYVICNLVAARGTRKWEYDIFFGRTDASKIQNKMYRINQGLVSLLKLEATC